MDVRAQMLVFQRFRGPGETEVNSQKNEFQGSAMRLLFVVVVKKKKSGRSAPRATSPVDPHPLNLGGAISPLKFWGWSVRNPLFYSVPPLNLGGEIGTP